MTMTKSGAAWIATIALLGGCKSAGQEAASPAPLVALPSGAAASAASSTAAPTPAVAASAAQASSSPSSCALWSGVSKVTARSQAGRGDFFRELRYDFTNGTLEVDDSDPFVNGKEEAKPRVLAKSRKLSLSERAHVENELPTVCPSAQAMAAACAPGGCLRLVVRTKSGETKVEDVDTVMAVMKLLAPMFSELRKQ